MPDQSSIRESITKTIPSRRYANTWQRLESATKTTLLDSTSRSRVLESRAGRLVIAIVQVRESDTKQQPQHLWKSQCAKDGIRARSYSPAFNEDNRLMILEFSKDGPDTMGPSRLAIGGDESQDSKMFRDTPPIINTGKSWRKSVTYHELAKVAAGRLQTLIAWET